MPTSLHAFELGTAVFNKIKVFLDKLDIFIHSNIDMTLVMAPFSLRNRSKIGPNTVFSPYTNSECFPYFLSLPVIVLYFLTHAPVF